MRPAAILALLLPAPALAGAPCPPAPPAGAFEVVATAYSWRERAHAAHGDRNHLGGSLRGAVEGRDQFAVPSVIRAGRVARYLMPPGTIIRYRDPLSGRPVERVGTDVGGAVGTRGGLMEIDIHFDTLGAMRAWGTRRLRVEVVRWGPDPARRAARVAKR